MLTFVHELYPSPIKNKLNNTTTKKNRRTYALTGYTKGIFQKMPELIYIRVPIPVTKKTLY